MRNLHSSSSGAYTHRGFFSRPQKLHSKPQGLHFISQGLLSKPPELHSNPKVLHTDPQELHSGPQGSKCMLATDNGQHPGLGALGQRSPKPRLGHMSCILTHKRCILDHWGSNLADRGCRAAFWPRVAAFDFAEPAF